MIVTVATAPDRPGPGERAALDAALRAVRAALRHELGEDRPMARAGLAGVAVPLRAPEARDRDRWEAGLRDALALRPVAVDGGPAFAVGLRFAYGPIAMPSASRGGATTGAPAWGT